MSTEKKLWKLWLHGKASEAMAAHEVWDMLKARTITEDTLVEYGHDPRGWSALRDYKEELRWQADARPAIVPQMPAPSDEAEVVELQPVPVLGGILLAFGLITGLMALGMDITVTAETGREVNNIGLMNDRMVQMVAAGFAALIGTIMMLMGSKR